MGFYFRKSKSVGPVRFNFSKSGIGVSTGVKGARLSLGPHGTYINVGRNGIYYRQKIGGAASSKNAHGSSNNSSYYPDVEAGFKPTDVIRVAPGSSEFESSILKDIKRAKAFDWLWAILFFLLAFVITPVWSLLLIVALRCLFPKLSNAVIQHDLDNEAMLEWEKFTEITQLLKTSKKLWIIETAQKNYNTKYHAGASRNLSRKTATVKIIKPKRSTGFRVKSDAKSVVIKSSKCSILFLPSVVVFRKGHQYAVYAYDELKLRSSTTSFIESESVPRDAEIASYTWQYVNKDGTADKRFNRNRRFPMCRYGLLNFYAGQQTSVELHISSKAVSENVGNAYQHYMGYVRRIGNYQHPVNPTYSARQNIQHIERTESISTQGTELFAERKQFEYEKIAATGATLFDSDDFDERVQGPDEDYGDLFETDDNCANDENALVDEMLLFMNEE